MSDIYADRLGNITVASGVVRMDFLRLVAADASTQQGSLEHSFRLAMPVDGALQTLAALEQIKAKLLEQSQLSQAHLARPKAQ